MTSAVQKEGGLLRAAFPAGHHYVKSHLPATRGEKEIAIEKHGPSKLARHSADAPSIETYCPTFPEKKNVITKKPTPFPSFLSAHHVKVSPPPVAVWPREGVARGVTLNKAKVMEARHGRVTGRHASTSPKETGHLGPTAAAAPADGGHRRQEYVRRSPNLGSPSPWNRMSRDTWSVY